MKRLTFVCFFLLAGCLILFGCTQLQGTRVGLTVTPSEGHPSVDDGGLRVTAHCTGGSGGTYEVDFGDGTPAVTCSGSAEHVYTPPFETNEYRVVARCGDSYASRTVRIQNQSPVFYGIYATQGGLLHQFSPFQLTELWVHYAVKGCEDCPDEGCSPYSVTGAKDPEGDPILFEWHIRPIGGAIEGFRKAAGGLTPAAAGYWVGEVGPEPFFPAQDGRILSHSDAMTAMRGGGRGGATNVTVNINTPVNLADKAFVQRQITPYILEALRKERVSGYL